MYIYFSNFYFLKIKKHDINKKNLKTTRDILEKNALKK
jgi:hypothetical protein